LDLKLRKEMQLELKELQSRTGTTFVYVTHDQEEAMTMSDRIAVMNGGMVEQLATPRELYQRPASAFVAGFIGTSNLISVRADRLTVHRLNDEVGAIDPRPGDVVTLRWAAEHSFVIGSNGAEPAADRTERIEREGQPT